MLRSQWSTVSFYCLLTFGWDVGIHRFLLFPPESSRCSTPAVRQWLVHSLPKTQLTNQSSESIRNTLHQPSEHQWSYQHDAVPAVLWGLQLRKGSLATLQVQFQESFFLCWQIYQKRHTVSRLLQRCRLILNTDVWFFPCEFNYIWSSIHAL